ncbi:hypothetical protein [Pantoea endophytica]|uniref:hypothetical protein n=1 Tax=Pantoea endophytica TaxID=92488 RepID=UPI0024138AB7|nr:hypothetical protein [Pantoea endophytica]
MSSREQFEAWAKAEGLINDPLGIRWVNEEFLNACWKAWQASRQTIEIALPVLEQQESTTDTHWQIENDGWIEWKGGKQPVSNSTLVEVKLHRDGYQGEDNAMTWDWTWRDGVDPIIAYRVIENDGREG